MPRGLPRGERTGAAGGGLVPHHRAIMALHPLAIDGAGVGGGDAEFWDADGGDGEGAGEGGGEMPEEDAGEEMEEVLAEDGGAAMTEEERAFDAAVGALEDVLMEPEFERLQSEFCRAHAGTFTGDREENKLEYTELFQRYQERLEAFLEKALVERVPNFDMTAFLNQIASRCAHTLGDDQDGANGRLQGEVFDVLFSLTDYGCFKELMWTYADEKNNGTAEAWGLTCATMAIHSDEQEDGEARPDLDGLCLSSPLAVRKPSGADA